MSLISRIAVVGAGFSGAVIARELADAGYFVDVFDQRDHLAGNCHTERDELSGVMVHKYGPHIFHTENQEVWNYLQRFTEIMPFVNRVKITTGGRVYSLPINLHTINQFYGKTLSPEQAKVFIESQADRSLADPRTFEEQALSMVGAQLYEAFFKGYTRKQWGCSPTELPASILKRLPLRFNYDDNYFFHKFQGIPVHGYTDFFEKILRHARIKINLQTRFSAVQSAGYQHVFFSGAIDEYFGFRLGRLRYRTLDFREIRAEGDFQGCAVMNYGDETVPYTRISEHKYFSPWETHNMTVCYAEYSRECQPGDIPYYPIRLVREKEMLSQYIDLARTLNGISFVGRLGTYRYLDMDVTVAEALEAARQFLVMRNSGMAIPVFFMDPG